MCITRFSDFQVNEIDVEGKIAELTNLEFKTDSDVVDEGIKEEPREEMDVEEEIDTNGEY